MLSQDNPDGTGDHENYFANSEVYDIDGQHFVNCTAKAVHIRSKGGHEKGHLHWWNLKEYTFFFSKRSEYFSTADTTYYELRRSIKPDYG